MFRNGPGHLTVSVVGSGPTPATESPEPFDHTSEVDSSSPQRPGGRSPAREGHDIREHRRPIDLRRVEGDDHRYPVRPSALEKYEMRQVSEGVVGPAPQTAGFNHVATLTADLDRYVDFYRRVFGAVLLSMTEARPDHPRMAIIDVGGGAHIGAFEVPAEAIIGDRRRIGGRGPVDHYGLAVPSMADLEAVRDRLVAEGASSGEINDFGSAVSVFFRDPDGAELEVCCLKVDH